MAIDILTVVLTAICTGIGISIGNALYDVYFKDPLKKLKKQNERLKKLHEKIAGYKRPWLAALLNMLFWGMGYFYIKRKKMLGALLLIIQIFVIGGFAFNMGTLQNLFEGVSYSFLALIISLYLGVDAYKLARTANAETK